MEPIDPNVLVRLDAPSRFEEAEVTTIEWQGRPMWSGRQLAQALEYERGDSLTEKITSDWSDELADGTDYVVVRGDELRALKAAAPGLVDARAPALTLLTESGVHLVALLSRQPKARALRRWLADEVLPSIRRTGGYTAPAALASAELTPLAAAVELARLGWSPEQVLALNGGGQGGSTRGPVESAAAPSSLPSTAARKPRQRQADANHLDVARAEALLDAEARKATMHLSPTTYDAWLSTAERAVLAEVTRMMRLRKGAPACVTQRVLGGAVGLSNGQVNRALHNLHELKLIELAVPSTRRGTIVSLPGGGAQ